MDDPAKSKDAGKGTPSPDNKGDSQSSSSNDPAKPNDASANTSSTSTDAVPTDKNTVPEIKAYLDAHHIAYNASDTKPQLLAKITGDN